MANLSDIQGLKEAHQKMKAIKQDCLINYLCDVSELLIKDALGSKEYSGFTGNTQTSYSCGVYDHGELVYFVSAGNHLKAPIRRKVGKGMRVFLPNPYEGDSRTVTGKVEVDDQYGQETALRFLQRYNPPTDGFALVMTTGTEYSVYLERKRNLTVLSETYRRAGRYMKQNVKRII